MNGGTHNARIVENTVAASSVDIEYHHWDMSFLLHLFGSGAICTVECSVPACADSAFCRAHASSSLGNDWSVSHITFWTSEDSKLAGR